MKLIPFSKEKSKCNTSLNVLVVGQYFPPDLGGGPTRAYNVAKGLLLNGCKVTVVTAFPHYPYGQIPKEYRWKLIKLEQLEGIRVIRTFMPPIMSRGFFSRLLLMGVFAVSSLFALPWVGGIDVVWADSWVPGIVYGKVKRKHVALNANDLTIEDMASLGLLDKDSFVAKLAERVYRFCYVKGDAVTPISPGYVETISRKYCVDRSRIRVVRGGVNLSIFEARPSFRHSGQKFRVLYAGVLGVGYDFDQVFRAAKIVEERSGDVEFVLHGGGECLGYIKDRIKEENVTNVRLSDRILNSRKEVAELLNAADALILPMKDISRPYLGIAMKIYEYQAVGKPVICCAEGQPATYIRETGSGIVVKPGDHEALARAVIYLRKNPEIARNMGENGRKYVENNLSIEAIGSVMKQILETLRRR
jgi:glycosyltransferase involved in cell wall biosynthesis